MKTFDVHLSRRSGPASTRHITITSIPAPSGFRAFCRAVEFASSNHDNWEDATIYDTQWESAERDIG